VRVALELFGGLLRDCLYTIPNTDLTDVQWIQITLPVKVGGHGVRLIDTDVSFGPIGEP